MLHLTYTDNGGKQMRYTTKYMTGCYQDLRPNCGGCCRPPFPPNCLPPCPPQCNVGNSTDGNLLYFMIGYLIGKTNNER